MQHITVPDEVLHNHVILQISSDDAKTQFMWVANLAKGHALGTGYKHEKQYLQWQGRAYSAIRCLLF
jgi:hypothetical protein